MKVVGSLLLHCITDSQVVELQSLQKHIARGCLTQSSVDLTVGQILSQPPNAPPTRSEEKLACSVVKRMMHTSQTGILTLPTLVQVTTISKCS